MNAFDHPAGLLCEAWRLRGKGLLTDIARYGCGGRSGQLELNRRLRLPLDGHRAGQYLASVDGIVSI